MPQPLPAGVITHLPVIRQVPLGRPLRWLAAGWADLRATPIASLAYGLLFAICGDIILLLALPHPHLFSLAVSGFFLVAPLLAAGLYEISRRRERGQATTFFESLAGWRRNGESIALFGLGLALASIIWERISAVLFALLYSGAGGVGTGIVEFFRTVVLSGEHLGFVLTWIAAGGMLALLIFSLSVVAVPVLLDRGPQQGGDLVTAARTSFRAVRTNPGTLLFWGVLLVTLTLIGFASLLFGLIVLMPLLGHATWHAYRDLVEPVE